MSYMDNPYKTKQIIIHNLLWVDPFMNGNKPYDLPVGKMNNNYSVDKSVFYPQAIKIKTTA
ncbi:hypothetical protein GV64_01850 [Endozoicomonas elysicola]|uniref:Uncharacterized protein n=2 Tax=Endozoicomonas elysicola TaxID=305900 RepID=A0A081K675_9GAMM|nr:hypothetical protein GV64_01850 [Endozoicomonas elysicola]